MLWRRISIRLKLRQRHMPTNDDIKHARALFRRIRAERLKNTLQARHRASGGYLRVIKDRLATKLVLIEDEELRVKVRDAILNADRSLTRLPKVAQEALIDALCEAARYAEAGMRLKGGRSRAAAWTQDLLVRDVCDALCSAGIPVPLKLKRDHSVAQRLAGNIAVLLGLPDQGELRTQMQRAKDIEPAYELPLSDKPLLILGRWRVPSLIDPPKVWLMTTRKENKSGT
jgi:hypothetical protein